MLYKMVNRFSPCGVGFGRLLSGLFILIGLSVPFMMIKLYVPLCDEYYQALNVRSYENGPLGMLTFFIGDVWCNMVGESLLNIRALMVICIVLSISFGCGYFFSKTRDLLMSTFLFLIMSLLSTHTVLHIYGWDVGVYPLITLTLIATLYYLERGSYTSIVLMGVSSALMVLSRIPTITVLPILLLIIIYRVIKHKDSYENPVREILQESIAGLAVFLLTAFITICIMGGFCMYVSSWSSDNIITGHSLDNFYRFFNRLICLGIPAVKLWGIVLILFIAACLICKIKRLPFFLSIIVKGSIALFITVVAYKLRIIIASPTADFGLGQGILLILVLYIPIYNFINKKKLNCPASFLLTLVAFSLLAAVGSDSAIERVLTLSIIPIAFVCVYPYKKTIFSWFFMLVFLLTSAVNLTMYRGLRSWAVYEIASPYVKGSKFGINKCQKIEPLRSYIREKAVDVNNAEFLGPENYEQYYILTDKYPPLLNQYHYDDDDCHMVKHTIDKLKCADFVFISLNDEYEEDDYKNIIHDLENEGYAKEMVMDNCLVLARKK